MKVRDVFFDEIYHKTKEGEDIVIVSSDIGAPSLDDYRRDFPNRFINVGIAEQNLLAVSSGLQLAGKKVVAYALNPFPVTRAFDQVRNIMASLQVPITVTALNAGTCSAEAGYTHMPIENVSLMRTLRNLQIVNPSDGTVAKKLADMVVDEPYPRYVQFDKYIEGTLYAAGDIDFGTGFITNGKESTIAVVAYGIMAHQLMKRNLPVKVIDCFCLPVQEEKFVQEVEGCTQIVTVEDGMVNGGIGSMVLEIFNDRGIQVPVVRKGLRFRQGYPSVFTNREMLWQEEGLELLGLEQEIRELCGG